MKTLLLNNGYQPIKAITWQRAICMHFLGKVDILEGYEKTISSPSVEFNVPAVVRLRKSTKAEPMRIRYSRSNILSRDNNTCQYCEGKFRSQDLTLDHVIPKSIGGKTTWTNIVACCKTCNTEKANRTPQQANMRLSQRPAVPSVKTMYSDYVDGNIPEQWSNWLFEKN